MRWEGTKRGDRMADMKRMKAMALFVMLNRWSLGQHDYVKWCTPAAIGRNAATHCRPCSCEGCKRGEGVRARRLKDKAKDS